MWRQAISKGLFFLLTFGWIKIEDLYSLLKNRITITLTFYQGSKWDYTDNNKPHSGHSIRTYVPLHSPALAAHQRWCLCQVLSLWGFQLLSPSLDEIKPVKLTIQIYFCSDTTHFQWDIYSLLHTSVGTPPRIKKGAFVVHQASNLKQENWCRHI